MPECDVSADYDHHEYCDLLSLTVRFTTDRQPITVELCKEEFLPLVFIALCIKGKQYSFEHGIPLREWQKYPVPRGMFWADFLRSVHDVEKAVLKNRGWRDWNDFATAAIFQSYLPADTLAYARAHTQVPPLREVLPAFKIIDFKITPKRCPACDLPLSRIVDFCSNCGHPLQPPEPKPKPREESPDAIYI